MTDAQAKAPPPASENTVRFPDPFELSRTFAQIGERSGKVLQEFVARHGNSALVPPPTDPLPVANAFIELNQKLMTQPARVVQSGMSLWQDYMRLWQNTARRFAGGNSVAPIIAPEKGDKRFQDPAWSENALFDFIKQSYLLSARWLQNVVDETEGLDPKTAHKVEFYTRQFVDAMSPSNFVMTNPEVLKRTAETGGENLVKGLENLLEDLERGGGQLRIAMTDDTKFELGKNVGITPGKVVYQNDLMQLIQYAPMTDQVKRVPFVIIPPWINKYYILDLGPKKSFVRFLLEQGHTVFMISWVNPDERLADKGFTDYMLEGPVDALRQVKAITGENEANILGYCLGGTLLGTLLAWMEGMKGKPGIEDLPKINSATFLVSMLDFRDVGDVAVFIDEEQISALEDHMRARGFLDGRSMATTFNLLRANDLIWSFVVNNYLMGKEPFPFDLLYWNADSTRMPAAMHSFYLREMYQRNRLAKPGAVKIEGVPIDLRTITTPSYFLSTRDDHISPWHTTYYGAQYFKGPVRFVLSGSGHIAGVVNPPAAKKYSHWTNENLQGNGVDLPESPDDWFTGAQSTAGSWWPDWDKWLAGFSGDPVPARPPGTVSTHPALEDAPGSYVKVRI